MHATLHRTVVQCQACWAKFRRPVHLCCSFDSSPGRDCCWDTFTVLASMVHKHWPPSGIFGSLGMSSIAAQCLTRVAHSTKGCWPRSSHLRSATVLRLQQTKLVFGSHWRPTVVRSMMLGRSHAVAWVVRGAAVCEHTPWAVSCLPSDIGNAGIYSLAALLMSNTYHGGGHCLGQTTWSSVIP